MSNDSGQRREASSPSPAQAWQFSLRALLVLLVVASYIAARTADWGWLFGWAATGCFAAFALAVWCLRYRRWRALGGAVVLAVIGIVPSILVAGVPFREAFSCCRYCGAEQRISENWLMPVRVTTSDTDASDWAHRVGLKESRHDFVGCSSTTRSGWFGSVLCACGGHNPVGTVYLSHDLLGEEVAIATLREYQSLLNQGKRRDADDLVSVAAANADCIREARNWAQGNAEP